MLKNSLLTTLFALFTLMNCTTQTTQPNMNREWMMTSFQEYNKEQLSALKAHINLTQQKDGNGRFSAIMGCNNLFFTAKFDGNGNVKFSNVGSTMMYCKDRMDLESAFSEALPKFSKYKIEGHHLTLSDPEGKQMTFVASDWD